MSGVEDPSCFPSHVAIRFWPPRLNTSFMWFRWLRALSYRKRFLSLFACWKLTRSPRFGGGTAE